MMIDVHLLHSARYNVEVLSHVSSETTVPGTQFDEHEALWSILGTNNTRYAIAPKIVQHVVQGLAMYPS